MNVAKLVEAIDRDALYEILSDWQRRVEEEGWDALPLLLGMLAAEVDRQYEQDRANEAYEAWGDE